MDLIDYKRVPRIWCVSKSRRTMCAMIELAGATERL